MPYLNKEYKLDFIGDDFDGVVFESKFLISRISNPLAAPLHKVSSFLGHSDPKITVKAYYSESEGLKVEDFIDVE